jgi:O-antigen ligase
VAVIQSSVVVVVALWSMLWPVHTHPETLFVIALLSGLAAVSRVLTGAARPPSGVSIGGAGALTASILVASRDPAMGGRIVAIAIAVLAVVWMARGSSFDSIHRTAFGVGVAILGLWAVAQAVGGLEGLRADLGMVPESLRPGFEARIDSSRGFAAQLFPGHLAALLATALPLALSIPARGRMVVVRWSVVAAIGGGLIATRSPIGLVLAALSLVVLVGIRSWRHWLGPAVGAVVVALGMIATRTDMRRLEPLLHRLDNWRAALWVWWEHPVAGAGLGGFGAAVHGQASDLVNRPSHAHCLPLEWLAEGGVLGLVAAVMLYTWLGRIIVRAWRRDRALAAAAMVVPVHNLVDFSWFNWGVAVPWAVVLGWTLAVVDDRGPVFVAPSRWLVGASAVATALAVGLAGLHWRASVLVRGAEDQPSLRAAQTTDRAAEMTPWNAVLGRVAAERWLDADPPRPDRGLEILAHRRWLQPLSASHQNLRGVAALQAGRPSTAMAAVWWAAALQPHSDRRRRVLEEIVGPDGRNARDSGHPP